MFLHGWGGNVRSFGGAFTYFSERGNKCLTLDFPPFGNSDSPQSDWSLKDYTHLTLSVLEHFGLENVTLVGHFFGVRLAIDIASNTNIVKRLVLVSSAGLKRKRGLIFKLKQLAFRYKKSQGKNVDKYYSPDYLAMPTDLRGVFSRIVSEDLSGRLKYVNCPTLIVWGRRDTETPPEMARRLKKKIKNSQIVWLDGGHFAYAEKHTAFVSVLDEFLGN